MENKIEEIIKVVNDCDCVSASRDQHLIKETAKRIFTQMESAFYDKQEWMWRIKEEDYLNLKTKFGLKAKFGRESVKP